MVNKDKLGSFCTIFNASNWEQYQDEIKNHLHIPTDARIDFPDGPKSYPCLVASRYHPVDATKANEFTYFKVDSCFVYLPDAQRLLDAAASVNESIIVEDEPAGIKMRPVLPEAQYAISDYDASEADLTVLVLAMLKELHAIGALKFDRLLTELPGVQAALEEHAMDQDEPEDMVEFLKALWERLHAG